MKKTGIRKLVKQRRKKARVRRKKDRKFMKGAAKA